KSGDPGPWSLPGSGSRLLNSDDPPPLLQPDRRMSADPLNRTRSFRARIIGRTPDEEGFTRVSSRPRGPSASRARVRDSDGGQAGRSVVHDVGRESDPHLEELLD